MRNIFVRRGNKKWFKEINGISSLEKKKKLGTMYNYRVIDSKPAANARYHIGRFSDYSSWTVWTASNESDFVVLSQNFQCDWAKWQHQISRGQLDPQARNPRLTPQRPKAGIPIQWLITNTKKTHRITQSLCPDNRLVKTGLETVTFAKEQYSCFHYFGKKCCYLKWTASI